MQSRVKFFPMRILHRYKLTNSIITLTSLFFILYANPSNAEVRYDADVITISGKIGLDAYDKLSTILSNESVSTVLFKNSGGGSFDFGLNIGKLISRKKIKTVAEGICASACAIAFLGGDSREFSSEQPDSVLMFHPGFERTIQIPAQETKAILFEWIEARTRRPLPLDFVAAMNKITKRKGGVYFLSPSHGAALKTGISVFFCEGIEENISNCAGQGDSSPGKMQITSTNSGSDRRPLGD